MDVESHQNENGQILNELIPANVVFKFSAVPLPEEINVYTLPIWTDGKGTMDYFDEFGDRTKITADPNDLDTCFFSVNASYMKEGEQPKHVLPKGFYCNEFLKLNPLNIQEFLFFQRKYGLITGARKRRPYDADAFEYLRPEPDGDIFAGARKGYYQNQLAGINASQALYDSAVKKDYLVDSLKNRMSAVSFREAIAATQDAQSVVRDLLRVRREDLGQLTVRETGLATIAAEYISIMLGKAIPAIQLVVEGNVHQRTYSLLDGVFIQLAHGLLNNDSYRICCNPECGRIFTPREMNRRLDTKYCCSECQERAKYLRYINRHSK